MNWFQKYGSPALYQPSILTPGAKANRFFNFLKSQNKGITAYHGSNSVGVEESKQSGYILAPMFTGNRVETGDYGGNQVFLTTSKQYAEYYANRAAYRKGSQPAIITLNIPLYAIAEVQSAIYATESSKPLHNEFMLGRRLRQIIFALDISDQQKISLLINEIQKTPAISGTGAPANELTGLNAIPFKWVTNVEILPPVEVEDDND